MCCARRWHAGSIALVIEMDRLYAPLLILLTSLMGYLYAVRTLRVERHDLVRAFGGALEFIGCWMLVYSANLLFGLVLIVLIRRLTGFFISVYVLGGIMLTLFTFLQALVAYHLWRVGRRK